MLLSHDIFPLVLPMIYKLRWNLNCCSYHILSANLTIFSLTVSMKVSFKKQMLQYQSRKYVSEIRMFMFPLVFVSEFLFHILTNFYFSLLIVFVWFRSFSLPEFVAEVQEATRPVLNAYMKVRFWASVRFLEWYYPSICSLFYFIYLRIVNMNVYHVSAIGVSHLYSNGNWLMFIGRCRNSEEVLLPGSDWAV